MLVSKLFTFEVKTSKTNALEMNSFKATIRRLSSSGNHSNFNSKYNKVKTQSSIVNCGSLKILVLGDKNVGKTSVCQRYVGYDLSPEENGVTYSKTTFTEYENEFRQYELEIQDLDSSKYNTNTYRYKLSSSDGFVLVYSRTDKISFMKLSEIITDIHRANKGQAVVVILGNKSDSDQANDFYVELHQQPLPIDHFDVSALENEGIHFAFQRLIRRCIKNRNKIT